MGGLGEHPDRIGEPSRDHEHDRRETPCPDAEALLQKRVRAHLYVSLEVSREQHEGDYDAAEDVAGDDLQESEVARARRGAVRSPRGPTNVSALVSVATMETSAHHGIVWLATK